MRRRSRSQRHAVRALSRHRHNQPKHASSLQAQPQAGMVMVNLPTAGVDYHVPFGGRRARATGRASRGAMRWSSTRRSRRPTFTPAVRDDRPDPHRCDSRATAEGIRILGPRIVDGAKTGADLAEPPDDPETATPSPTSIRLTARSPSGRAASTDQSHHACCQSRARQGSAAGRPGHSARMAWPPPRAASLAPAPSDCRCPLNGAGARRKLRHAE